MGMISGIVKYKLFKKAGEFLLGMFRKKISSPKKTNYRRKAIAR